MGDLDRFITSRERVLGREHALFLELLRLLAALERGRDASNLEAGLRLLDERGVPLDPRWQDAA